MVGEPGNKAQTIGKVELAFPYWRAQQRYSGGRSDILMLMLGRRGSSGLLLSLLVLRRATLLSSFPFLLLWLLPESRREWVGFINGLRLNAALGSYFSDFFRSYLEIDKGNYVSPLSLA